MSYKYESSMRGQMLMNMKNFFFLSLLLSLTGCGRLVDWGKELVPQGNSFKQNLAAAREYIRSVTAYDQLSTAASFDALWLSDEVRSAYVRLFIDRRGKSEEQYSTILRRQLEENNFVIAFYILCPFEVTLGNSDAEWMVFLRVDKVQYTPIEVKIVDLAPEYRALFDKNLNRFKQAYLVKFDARDAHDKAIIETSTKALSLVFRSLRKDLMLTWDFAKMRLHKNDVQSQPVPAQMAEPTVTKQPAPKDLPALASASASTQKSVQSSLPAKPSEPVSLKE